MTKKKIVERLVPFFLVLILLIVNLIEGEPKELIPVWFFVLIMIAVANFKEIKKDEN